MLFWSIAVACVGVFFVFQSVGVDYRFVAAGAVLPLALSAFWGRPALGHAMILPVALLVLIMMGTMHARLRRRRWLGLPIGTFLGQVAVGAFTSTHVFMWPTQGWEFPPGNLLPSWPVVVVAEVAGVLGLLALGSHAQLTDPQRRERLLTAGRLDAPAVATPRPGRNTPRPKKQS